MRGESGYCIVPSPSSEYSGLIPSTVDEMNCLSPTTFSDRKRKNSFEFEEIKKVKWETFDSSKSNNDGPDDMVLLDDILMLDDITAMSKEQSDSSYASVPTYTDISLSHVQPTATTQLPQQMSSNLWDQNSREQTPFVVQDFNESDPLTDTFQDLSVYLQSQQPTSSSLIASLNYSALTCSTIDSGALSLSSTEAVAGPSTSYRSSSSAQQSSLLVDEHPAGPSTTTPLQRLAPPSDKYSELRKRNNIASKRSRMSRKEKEREMEDKAAQLEADNEAMKAKIQKLEEVNGMLKKYLISAFVKK